MVGHWCHKSMFYVLRVKPIVLRVKRKYYYILIHCFTRKTVGFTRKVKRFTRKSSVLRVKAMLLRVNDLFYA